jgi:hypothetical protein
MQEYNRLWDTYSKNWDLLKAPMRPTTAVIRVLQQQIGEGHVLQLGCTPEIHAAFDHITAVDRDPNMIATVWPGNTATKQVINQDWMHMIWPHNTFTGIVSDCGVVMLGTLQRQQEFLSRCWDWLAPGGTYAQRYFERPMVNITFEELLADISGPAKINFHAFKWKMGMYLAGQHGAATASVQILDLWREISGDREAVLDRTGWSAEAVQTVDFYQTSGQVVTFANREEYASTIPAGAVDVEWLYTTDYDFAEHCPIMRWRKPL